MKSSLQTLSRIQKWNIDEQRKILANYLEEETKIEKEIDSLKNQYGTEIVDVMALQAFLKKILGNSEVANYLQKFHEPIYGKFKEISELDFFRLHDIA